MTDTPQLQLVRGGKPLTEGLHYDVTPERYHDDPCERPALSSSIAKELVLRSPRHAYLIHPKLGGVPSDPTREMDLGTLMHCLVLGAGRRIVLVEHDDWKTNDAKKKREEARAAGAIPVLQAKLLAAEARAKAIRFELRRQGIWLDGKSEVVAVWKERADDGTEVWCRSQLDHFDRARGRIWDLKFNDDVNPETSARKVVPMGYYLQEYVYTRAISKLCPELAGRVKFEFLFCENDTDLVKRCECGGDLLDIARAHWRQAINRWAWCLRTGKWPGYGDDVYRFAARPFEIARFLTDAPEEDHESPPAGRMRQQQPEQEAEENEPYF